MGLKNVCWKPDRLLFKLKLDQSVDQQSFLSNLIIFIFLPGPLARCMWGLVFLISQATVLSFSITGNTCHTIMD